MVEMKEVTRVYTSSPDSPLGKLWRRKGEREGGRAGGKVEGMLRRNNRHKIASS